MCPTGLAEPGIEASLDVHLVVGRPRPFRHREFGSLRSEMIRQQAAD
jgi:hypothetical protein